MTKTLRSLLAGCAAGALAAGAAPAVAQDASSWNTDGKAGISQPEWQAGLERNGTFDRLDSDGNGAISESEFEAGVSDSYDYDPGAEMNLSADSDTLYERWDSDGDGTLSKDEFGTGSYAAIDTNSDGRIDPPEFPRLGTQGAGRNVPSLQGQRGGGGVGGSGDVGVDTDIGGGVGNDPGVRGGGGVSIDPDV